MNRWNIPQWLEQEVIRRDPACVYCGVSFSATLIPRSGRPSWEHIVNDTAIVNRDNIARCCIACNASKGTKDLAVWIESQYCLSRGISRHTVAPVIQQALHRAAAGG
jgi:hypothetical protein